MLDVTGFNANSLGHLYGGTDATFNHKNDVKRWLTELGYDVRSIEVEGNKITFNIGGNTTTLDLGEGEIDEKGHFDTSVFIEAVEGKNGDDILTLEEIKGVFGHSIEGESFASLANSEKVNRGVLRRALAEAFEGVEEALELAMALLSVLGKKLGLSEGDLAHINADFVTQFFLGKNEKGMGHNDDPEKDKSVVIGIGGVRVDVRAMVAALNHGSPSGDDQNNIFVTIADIDGVVSPKSE